MAERLAARTVKDDVSGCWNIQGCRVGRNGYGQIMRDPKSRVLDYTHRVAWELVHGPIPAGQYVCHRCDNPRCVNPSHLFLGTQQDNIRDAVRKGRWTVRKLTDDQVAELRTLKARGATLAELADYFGISKSTAKHIAAGRQRAERIGEPLDVPSQSNQSVESIHAAHLPVSLRPTSRT